MPGGLLNIAAYGAENVILTGNPTKTFFNATYQKYTNFGLQRFRIDYEGQRTLNFNSETEMNFKIPRYAELLWDTYLVVNLPDIWSPLFWQTDVSGCMTPYEFQWINKLGALMIKEITVYSGSNILSRYSGEYIEAAIQRDDGGKKVLWDRMIGAINQFTDPANAFQNGGFYPNANFLSNPPPNHSGSDVQPSIKGRRLYIPLEAWFTYSGGKTALPLVALQYQEINIRIRLRSIKELYTIRDVENPDPGTGKGPRKAPNPASAIDQLYWFLQPPQDPSGIVINPQTLTQRQNLSRYVKKNNWDADIHLMSTYVFLSQDERRVFAANKHTYLVRETFEHDFLNVAGSRRVDIPCRDMVPSFLFRFRRSDANDRNEWTNYSNWPFEGIQSVQPVDMSNNCTSPPGLVHPFLFKQTGPLVDSSNLQNILLDMGILLGSEYRENILEEGVYNFVEKWIRTDGFAKNGLYAYNFSARSRRDCYQPSGAQNMNKWQYVTFEFNTIQPPLDTDNNNVEVLCDPSGGIIGVRKDTWRLNKWNFDLRIWEERYNMIVIENGSIGLLIAR
uniref:Major capsid protein N-terminal domain-containing protein n=1 Tax=viral metagenome TaxID=1070528 RepID=A0A6C0EP79_9ZZZZ